MKLIGYVLFTYRLVEKNKLLSLTVGEIYDY